MTNSTLQQRTRQNPFVADAAKFIEYAFRDLYQSITVIGSFAVGEYTQGEDARYMSDIDFHIVLKKGIYHKDCLEIVHRVYHNLNYENNIGPTVSIWIVEYDTFYAKNPDDTLIPYQIHETGETMYGRLDKEKIPNSIEFNSHIGLCGVAYMQLLKGVHEKNVINLAKAVFNQIGCFLISKAKYKTSYYDRIGSFLALFPAYGRLQPYIHHLYKVKISGSQEYFYDIFGSIANFTEQFQTLFSLDALHTIFHTSGTLEEFADTITSDNDTHKYIRAAYICYYLRDLDLSTRYIQKAMDHIGYQSNENISVDLMNDVQQHWVKTIGVFD